MKKTLRRVLSFVMAVLLTFITVISDVDYSVHAEEVTRTTYEKVTSLSDVLAGGDFVVVANNSLAMGTEVSNSKISTNEVSISDNQITGDTIPVWKISAVDGTTNGVSFNNGTEYLKYTGTKTNLALDSEAYTWIASEDGNGDFGFTETTNTSNQRAMAVNPGNNNVIGVYVTTNSSYTFSFSLYKVTVSTVEEPVDPVTPDPEPEVTTLVADGTYVIYNPSSKMALSSTATGTYYRAGVEMTLNENGTFDNVAATEIWTVKNNEDKTVTISCEAGTLSMSDSASSINFEEGNTHTTWNLTKVPEVDGQFYISNATKPEGKYGPYYLEWYAKYTEFTGYSTGNMSEILQFMFVPVSTSPETPVDPVDPVIPDPEPEVNTLVKDGNYVIYNPSSSMAMSQTAVATNYRAGVEMTLNADGKFDEVAATEIWAVKNNEDGTVTISCDAGVLSVGASYASANFNTGNEYTTWNLTASESNASIIYISVNGKASKTGLSSYLKWDSSKKDFTTNAIKNFEADAFAMQFVSVDSSDSDDDEDETKDEFEGKFVIYNEANEMALSSVYSGNYNSGVSMKLNEKGSFDSVVETEVWTFAKNEAGTYTISQGENKLSMDTSYSSMPLNKANDTWEITKNENGTVYIKNVGRGNYIEWYADKKNWSSYSKITDATAKLFALKLVSVSDDIIKKVDSSDEDDNKDDNKDVVISDGLHYLYSASAAGVMKYGITAGCAANVAAELSDDKLSLKTEAGKLTGAAVLDFKYDSAKEAYVITCGGKYLAANSSEELYLADALSDTATACTYWVFGTQEKFAGYTIKSKSVTYNNYEVYMEYYSSKGFCLYTAKAFSEIYMFEVPVAAADCDADNDGYAYGTVPVAQPAPVVGGTVVISNDANGQVISSMIAGVDGGESKMGAVNVSISEDGVATPSNGALIFNVGMDSTLDFSSGSKFTVTIDENGYYTFVTGGKYLTGSEDGKSLSLADKASDYSLWKLETNGEGFYIVNVNSVYTYKETKYDAAIEYYGGYFTLYEINRTNSKYSGDAYTMQFYGTDGKKLDTLTNGAEVVIFNPANKYVVTEKATSTSNKLYGAAVGASGGGYYYFENNGQYLATNNDEELLVQSELNDMAKWELVEVMGGYLIKSKAAAWTSSSGNSYPIYIEYFSGAFAGYSYKATSADIFTFNFYPVEDKYNTGYVINPVVDFKTEAEANWDVNYTMNFVLDDLGTITSSAAEVTFEDGTNKKLDVELTNYDGKVVVDGKDLVGHSSMDIKVSATSKETDTVTVDFNGTKTVAIVDNPVITAVTPAPNAQTGTEKQPTVIINYANIGENAIATLTLNGAEVALKQNTAQKTFSYAPEAELVDGKYTAVATITRADGKTASKTWSFNVGYSGIQLYFGQIHSHTAEYSDGSGTLEQAYEYAMKKAADIDYMIVTDHSNYFDKSGSATKDSIYDAAASSLTKSQTKGENGELLTLWQEANATAAYYNGLSDDFIAAYGYEMTWSGGPGHINVFNTLGLVSRNNTELNTKTNNSGMLTFYDLLVDANSKNATYTGDSAIIAQFNHPGTTFGYFDSFTGWNKDRDEIMNLIEVGNGDGAIGGTAYFPSYEYYDMCLTVGWHVAPTNGQDNHKGSWGDSNTARTVVLTSDFTESGLYDAMNARQVYSTEDQNLSMVYYLNDTLQGGIIDCKDENVKLAVSLSDKDTEALGYVYVIGLDGKVLYTSNYIGDNTADLEIELKNTSPYYYVKVVEKDGDIAVSAPVWVSDVAKESEVSVSLACSENPVQKTAATLTATITNGDAKDIKVQSYSVSVDGKAVENKTLSTKQTVSAGKNYELNITWTPDNYGTHEVKVAFTYLTSDNQLVTRTASKKVYVKGTDYDSVSGIGVVKAGTEGAEFTVEGYVTANTSGYDKNTAFFDCTYVQDATGGINLFPVSDSLKVGQKVRAHGAITYYNGEIELNLSEDYGGYIEVIDENVNEVAATVVSTKEAMDAANIGLLMQITGTVTKVHEASGIVDRIYVQDESGVDACVYINGYIWNSKTESFENFGSDGLIPVVGDTVSVVGIGSVDVDELGEVEYLHRLRIRDRAEIQVATIKTHYEIIKKKLCEVDENGNVVNDKVTAIYEDKAYVNGSLVTSGASLIDGKIYYSMWTGAIVKNKLSYKVANTNGIDVVAGYHRIDADGVVSTATELYTEDGKTYAYVDGVLQTSGVVEIDGKLYYSTWTGAIVKDSISYKVAKTNGYDVVEGYHLIDADGVIYTGTALIDIDNATYAYVNGVIQKGEGLIKIDGKYYYTTWEGKIVKGKKYLVVKTSSPTLEGEKFSIGFYTFDETGALVL